MGQRPGQFSASFGEDEIRGVGHCFQEAFGHMTKGLGVDRLLASFNYPPSLPTPSPIITFSIFYTGWEGPDPESEGVLLPPFEVLMIYGIFLSNEQPEFNLERVGKAQPKREVNVTPNAPPRHSNWHIRGQFQANHEGRVTVQKVTDPEIDPCPYQEMSPFVI